MAKHKKEKYLTLILRHQPEVAGITLDRNGWANVSALVNGVKQKYPDFDEAALRYIVETSEKKRFEYSNETRTAIRACQGHSVKIDLGLPRVVPPVYLYHGTTWRAWESIKTEGINSASRTHVQLSEDVGTAYDVGLRHGDDVCILEVLARAYSDDGGEFSQSVNGVWLVKHVPALYLHAYAPSAMEELSPYKDA